MPAWSPGPVIRRTTEYDLLVQHRLRELYREIERARDRLASEAELELLDHLCGFVAGMAHAPEGVVRR